MHIQKRRGGCFVAATFLILWLLVAPPTKSEFDMAKQALLGNRGKVASWVMENTENGAEAEILVVLADQADLSPAARLTSKLEKGRFVYHTLLHKAQSTQEPILRWLREQDVACQSFYIVNMIKAKVGRPEALALASRSDVAKIEGNVPVRNLLAPLSSMISAPLDSPNGIEPNILYVRAPEVWTMGYTGRGIVLGGQDTGYQWDHPALLRQYRGWDGNAPNHDYNWHDSVHSGGGRCGPDSTAPCDDHGHGTHTMGTAVGSDGGSNQIGMAPGARWIGCRNMNQGVGSASSYCECFEFFLAPYPVGTTPAQGDPARAPDITINSWGCPPMEGCAADTLLKALQAQRAAGIVTIASAGNGGPACSSVVDPPAIYQEVMSIGALNTGTDTIASFSSRGPVTSGGSNHRKPDLAAPGTGIRSSVPDGGYAAFQGTSMAAPHVAGALALILSARPSLRNGIDAVEGILTESAVHIHSTDCGSKGWPNNTFGYGRLDARSAVDLALRRGMKDFVGTWAGQGVYYLNSEDNTWAYIASPASMVAAGDFDGDGIDDLAAQYPDSGVWIKCSNTGQWVLVTSAPASSIAAGNLNGGSKAELIGIWSSVIWVFDVAKGSWTSIASGASQLAAGDLDGDGKGDLIGVWPLNAVWARYSSTGEWVALASSADWISAADLNGDGKDDLIGIWKSTIWARDSATGAWTSVSAGARQVAAGDLDGDGKADPIGIWPEAAWALLSSTGQWVRLSSAPDWIGIGRMH